MLRWSTRPLNTRDGVAAAQGQISRSSAGRRARRAAAARIALQGMPKVCLAFIIGAKGPLPLFHINPPRAGRLASSHRNPSLRRL
jgi:hypothetical protein